MGDTCLLSKERIQQTEALGICVEGIRNSFKKRENSNGGYGAKFSVPSLE